MGYCHLNMDQYKRKNHFEYFKSLAYPYVGVSVNVKITGLLAAIKKRHLPFFLTFNYCVANAVNLVPEFRQRIAGDGIIEFECCKTSHTVALMDGTYCYCTLDCDMPFDEYLPNAIRLQEMAKQEKLSQDHDDTSEMIYVSTLPWLAYTALVQPTPIPADSNPRMTWGAFFEQGCDTFIPVSVLCNHALVDGLHISQFYDALNNKIAEMTDIVKNMRFE